MQFSKKDEYRKYFVERFGVPPEIMDRYYFYERGKKVWAFTGEIVEIENIEALGIRALSLGRGIKPSTAFLRIIGKYATKNIIVLEEKEAEAYMRGEDIEKDFPVKPGYVIVRSRNDILGCGLYKGKLINQIPKKYRMMDTWV